MNGISRRDFLKLGTAGVGALLLSKTKFVSGYLPEFPTNENLGRLFYTVDIMSKPDTMSSVVKTLYEDNVVNLYRELIGANGLYGYRSKTWYETDEGYIYAPTAQPVKNIQNTPFTTLPTYETQPGFWAEVTVPYVDLTLINETPQSPLLIQNIADGRTPRFYYSQVVWINEISTGIFGEPVYRVLEKHGSPGDIFYADARAFKPILPEDLSPINPDVANKEIVVDLTHQSLSCYEDSREIFYAVVSTGAKSLTGEYVEEWATPVSDNHVVNRKYVSLHMAGGSESKASGWEEFAVGYTSIFALGGVSFHSTYWHNAWGSQMSHGCVNMKPEESKFIYRWTMPSVPSYEEGKFEQEGYGGTKVRVIA